MNIRELKQAMRAGTHVIAFFAETNFRCRVFDVRRKKGNPQILVSTGWVSANGADVYEWE